MKTEYLSEERHKTLQEELNKLKTDGRIKMAQRLKYAKDLGDLSENSEYQEAREEQSRLETKINQIEELLRNFSIIQNSTSGRATVHIGSKIKVKKNGVTVVYHIVGSQEASPENGMISNESPIGKCFLGKKVGDKFAVKIPKGEAHFEIISID